MINYIIQILYKCISLLDNLRFNKLSEHVIYNIDIKYSIEIETDTGYKPISNLIYKIPFENYILELENGYRLECADEHIVFDKYYNEVFVQDLRIGNYIITDKGLSKVISITNTHVSFCMCDLTVNDENHRFYSNGILSHNSVVTGIYGLWKTLFTNDNNALVLSKSGAAGKDLIKKIKDMYLYLPYHLKAGTMKWNSSEISFDNNSSIHTESFSDTAGLGSTINTLILDEFAWCPANEVDLFYENIIPTVTTMSNSNVCIMSTQNGFNKFYEIWNGAITKKNIYAPFKTDWYDVPQYNPKTKQWDKRDEKWKEMMTGVLGSEEAFYYQYGTQFSASDKCLVSRECLGRMRDMVRLYENKEIDWLILQYKDCLTWDPEFDLEDLESEYFFILVDLAEGGGGDYTVFQIFRIDGDNIFTQVGTWTSNKVDLEKAALEFWLLAGQLFNNDRCLFSLEWNTYGALFYKIVIDLNEPDYDIETLWRFNCRVDSDGLDQTRFVNYKKTKLEEEIGAVAKKKRTSNFVPGIRFTGGNKSTACSLLKILFEKEQCILTSLTTLAELENFEDKNGNGSYKASFGHDDLIMCCAQIPMMQQTPIWKDFIEDYKVANLKDSLEAKQGNNTNSFYGSIGGYDRGTQMFSPPMDMFMNNFGI